MDKFGRRNLFCKSFSGQNDQDTTQSGPLCERLTATVIGFPALAANLLIEALLQRRYLNTDSRGGNIAAVAFIYLFIVLFQFIDAPSFVWCAEIFPTTIRSKGIGLAMFAYFVGFITFSTPAPLAFRNM